MELDVSILPELPPRESWPPAFATLRNDQHRKFAWAYLFTGGEGSASARVAGYSDKGDGCKVRASELLLRDDINAALRELSTKFMFSLAPKALFRLGQVLDMPQHPKHMKAIELTLSKTYFPDQQVVQHHHTGSIELSHTDAALEALSYLKSMSVPREKLIEQFGHSGLARYEKMLEERDAKRGVKLIEGRVE